MFWSISVQFVQQPDIQTLLVTEHMDFVPHKTGTHQTSREDNCHKINRQ